jgi:3-phenylpropionate/trans-cinnamate dioxygenase ferredoxin reductase subunit
VEYHQLALATGSIPRSLSSPANPAVSGVYSVRNLADVDAMAQEFQPGRRVLIVGGGYIGLEAAAVAAKLGLEVTLIEMAPRILQRVASPETAAFFRELHESHGVRILEGVGLERLTEESGRVTGALLSDGQDLSVDFVIAGVGIAPATGLAEAAGLRVENGIWTDAHGRTSDPAIWAAGDCASFPWNGGRLRLESVGHAIDHAECVASNMLGTEKPYTPKPWFWSDQYDVKLQIAGLNFGYDSVVIRNGTGEHRSIWYYRDEQLLAVDAINDPRSFMVARRILEAGQTVERALVQDVKMDVKQLLAAATTTCSA